MNSRSVVTAFVLITVEAPRSGDVVEKLMEKFEEVAEAAAVYGEADVIAKISAPSIERLHELVMSEIQDLPKVTVTRTFIVVPQLHEIR